MLNAEVGSPPDPKIAVYCASVTPGDLIAPPAEIRQMRADAAGDA